MDPDETTEDIRTEYVGVEDRIDLTDFQYWSDELIYFEIENGCNPWTFDNKAAE